MTQAIIIAGGAISPVFISTIKESNTDFIIACDQGAEYLEQAGIQPNLLVGDLDSISEQTLSKLRLAEIPIEQHSVNKESSDLELAIDAAIKRGFEKIKISCALGNRTDYTLANTNLLLRQKYKELEISINEDNEQIIPLHNDIEQVISKPPSKRFSIILNGEGYVSIEGAKWNLDNEYIVQGSSRLVSNLVEKDSVSILLKKTSGLVVFSNYS